MTERCYFCRAPYPGLCAPSCMSNRLRRGEVVRGLVSGGLVWIHISPQSRLLTEERSQLEAEHQNLEAHLEATRSQRRILEDDIARLEDGITAVRVRLANVDHLQADGAAPQPNDGQPESEPGAR